MKKLFLSVVIATITLSLVGCGTKSNSELEDVNKQLENAYSTIDKLEAKVDELSDKVDYLSDIDLEYYNENNSVVKITRIGREFEEGYYEELVKEYEAKGKKVIAPSEGGGNVFFIIEPTKEITNVTYSSYGDEFLDECEIKSEKYIKKYGLYNQGNLTEKLNSDEVLIIYGHGASLPMFYFYWTEDDGKVRYLNIL